MKRTKCFRQFATMCVTAIALLLVLRLALSKSPTTVSQQENLNKDEQENLENSTEYALNINFVEENLLSLDQMDPQLIYYTRVKYLTPPSKLPYNLKKAGNNLDTFSRWIVDFFKHKRGGTFIEAGAHQGEDGSHSLHLEKELGWTGLLVECNPLVIPYLKSKHRKAWIADVCLSPTNSPATLNFSNPVSWSYSGTLGQPWKLPVATNWTFFEVQSIPLYTVLAALGWKDVDYFSFDIEGQELNVLKTFPFDLFTFKVLIIEVQFYKNEQKQELNQLLESNDYVFVKKIQVDHIYVHKNYINFTSQKL